MEWTLKIGSLLSLLAIAYQDLKERKVYAFLFILAGICTSVVYFLSTSTTQFFFNLALNFVLVLFILGLLFGYTRLKLKQPLFTVFGLGDLFFFIVFASGFPVHTFMTLFVASLIFALVVFLALKPKLTNTTVPLAGLQAFFLLLVLSTHWVFNLINIYQ